MRKRDFIKKVLIIIIIQILSLTFTSIGRMIFTKNVFATDELVSSVVGNVEQEQISNNTQVNQSSTVEYQLLTSYKYNGQTYKTEGNETGRYLHIILPKDLKDGEKVPLVVHLPGQGAINDYTIFVSEQSNAFAAIVRNGKAYKYGKFILVIPRFYDGEGSTEIKRFIDKLQDTTEKTYIKINNKKVYLSEHIDSNRIILSGHSTGGGQVLSFVKSYPNYLAGAIPVSCAGTYSSEFTKTPMWGIVGDKADRYGNNDAERAPGMKSIMREINKNGGSANMTQFSNCAHDESLNFFNNGQTFEYSGQDVGSQGDNVLKWIMEQNKVKSIENCIVTLSTATYTYDGTAKKPTVTVKDGTKTLVKGTNYTVAYSNNTNAGTATVTITGKGKYTGTVTKTYTINAKSISSCNFTQTNEAIIYDGTAKKLKFSLNDGMKRLVLNTDYMITYSNNVNAGTATVKIVGKGNYKGELIKAYGILKRSINTTNILLYSDSGVEKYTYYYTGKEIKPTVKVYSNGQLLTNGVSYTIDNRENNISAGTSTITISGEGNYTGKVTKTFNIAKVSNTLTIKGKNLTYTGKSQQLLTAQNAKGIVYYSTAKKLTSTNYTDGKTSIPTGITSKSYTIYYYTPGTTNYKAKSGSVTAIISVNPPQSMPDEIEASEYTYIEEIIEPTCTENGYIRYICEETGDEYQEEGAMALGHDFVDGVCTRCHKEELLVDTEVYNIEKEEKWIAQIDPDTLLSTLKEWIETNANQIKAYKGEKELQEEDKIGTGSKIIFTKGEDTLEYELSVIGDIDGNGKVDFFDIVEANKYRLNLNILENIQKLAGDIDGNGEVDFFDMIEINKYRLGV